MAFPRPATTTALLQREIDTIDFTVGNAEAAYAKIPGLLATRAEHVAALKALQGGDA